MTIYNGRPIADQLSLEREGFILVNHETKMKNLYDEDEIRDLYYKETEELVKRTSGAKAGGGFRSHLALRRRGDA